MRVGSYEIIKSNQWCYQLCLVMPEEYDNTKSKYRTAADGRALRPVECYPDTLAAALRKVAEFEARDGIDDAELMDVAARVESVRDEISELADRIMGATGGDPDVRGL